MYDLTITGMIVVTSALLSTTLMARHKLPKNKVDALAKDVGDDAVDSNIAATILDLMIDEGLYKF